MTYQQRAQQHRPSDLTVFAREAATLASMGLKPRDVASALGIPAREAVQLLKVKL
jgi:hypothetical protein